MPAPLTRRAGALNASEKTRIHVEKNDDDDKKSTYVYNDSVTCHLRSFLRAHASGVVRSFVRKMAT